MKIYTKTGDDGSTALFAGGRVRKNHLRVEAYGTVDELNSHIGMARALTPSMPTEHELITIQEHLFRLGADLATPLDANPEWLVRLTAEEVAWLEYRIDQFTIQLEPLKNFILPGGVPVAAQLHVARTVCRRAERLVVALGDREPLNEQSLIYLNRLSDWFFTAARYENLQAGVPESKWAVRS